MAGIVAAIIQVFVLLVIARALASWFVRDWSSGVARFLWDVTEPVLGPVRRIVPPIGGSIDISPLIVIFGLEFVLSFLGGGYGGLGI